jgi:hypothetical protein
MAKTDAIDAEVTSGNSRQRTKVLQYAALERLGGRFPVGRENESDY